MSNFADQHPGGAVISTYFGRDATDVFSTFHASTTWKLLRTFYIGDLVVSLLFRILYPSLSLKLLYDETYSFYQPLCLHYDSRSR